MRAVCKYYVKTMVGKEPMSIQEEEGDASGTALMDHQTTTKPATKTKYITRRNVFWVLVALVVIFAAFFVLMTVLYATKKKESKENFKAQKKTSGNNVCISSDCVMTVSDLLQSVNPDVDPCVDFYAYSCGGWIKKNPVPKDRGTWDQWTKLEKEVEDFVEKAITSSEVRARYSKVSAVMKAFDFYDSCVNLRDKSTKKGEPLIKLIEKYIAWPPINATWNDSSFDLVETLAKLNRDLNIDPFFLTFIQSDLRNSSNNMITLKQPYSMGLYHGQLTSDSPSARLAKAVYKEAIVNITTLLGLNDTAQLREMAGEILQLEESMAKLRKSYNDFKEEILYGKYQINHLSERTGKDPVDWLQYINTVFQEVGYEFKDDEEIIVYDIPYFYKITKFLKKLSKKSMLTYLGWIIIQANYINLGKDFLEIQDVFDTKAFGFGIYSRAIICRVRTKEMFGMPLGRIFVDERFSGESKKLAEEIASQIKHVFRESLKQNEWMDEKSRLAAIQKAHHMSENFGYPDYIVDDKKLDKEFERVEVDKDSFFKTMLSTTANIKRTELLLANQPVDGNKWEENPLLVNAYYEPTQNKMVFPAAFLQPPFYDHRYSRAVSYGGMGAIIAHELIHGFDDIGKDYDKHGNNIKWWSDETIAVFKNRTQCLVKQYSNITFYGKKISGEGTLSENIGDNGGIKQAFQAYQQWKNDNGEEPRLPGLMLSNDQVFFISFARNWCKTYTPVMLLFETFHDYAPFPIRVNASLQNLEAFSRAFKCPIGSPMNPKKKCPTW